MSSATITLANSLLDQVLRAIPYTAPGNVYLALFTTAPTSSGGGTEVTGGSYSRPQITFTAASGGATSNANLLQILGMPAVTVVGLAVMSASSGGTMLFYGNLLTAKTTNAGDTFVVQPNSLNIALS
jgi:hypothetical protein